MIICLTVGLVKKMSLHKTSYYLEPACHIRNKIKVKLDLSNYTTNSDVK